MNNGNSAVGASRDLTGKTVLLQAVQFFGYDRVIVEELERRGATVDFLADRPFSKPYMQAATKLFREQVLGPATRLYRDQLNAFGRSHYDHVIVINGQTMSVDLLKALRNENARARFTLYMWDSFNNKSYASDFIKYVDRAFSFDKECCDQFGLVYRPLFFSPQFDIAASKNIPVDFDLSFIGTAHSDRYQIISRLSRTLPEHLKTYWYLYLQAPWVYWAYKARNPSFREARLGDFKFVPLALQEAASIFQRSGAIVDIEHAKQSGLTMRTFEAMGSGKKLITTNRRIVDEDFYHPDNIAVIDRLEPKIPEDFLSAPFAAIDSNVRARYTISGFIDELLGAGQGDCSLDTNSETIDDVYR